MCVCMCVCVCVNTMPISPGLFHAKGITFIVGSYLHFSCRFSYEIFFGSVLLNRNHS